MSLSKEEQYFKKHAKSFFNYLDHATQESLYGDSFNELKNSYITLKNLSKKFTAQQIAKLINKDEKVIRFLCLGLEEHENDTNRFMELANVIVNNSGKIPIAILLIKYLKSESGFRLCYPHKSKKKLDSTYEEDIKTFFNNVFGLELSQELVSSVRAEEIGSIIAYALSGKAENIKEEYQTYMNNLKNLPRYSNELEFLLAKAKENDIELQVQQNKNSKEMVAYIDPATNKENLDVNRPKLRSDHCIVNFFKKIITVGNTTTNTTMEWQGSQCLDYFIATLNLTKIDYKSNGFQHYKVNPFYFIFGGFLSTKPFNEFNERNMKGRDTAKGLSDCTFEERRSIGQLPFLALLGNMNHPSQAAALFCHNPIIAGTDTLDLFQLSEKVKEKMFDGYSKENKQERIHETNKLIFDVINLKCNQILDGLNKSSLSAFSSKAALGDMLENLTGICNSMMNNFYMNNKECQKKMETIYKKVNQLVETQMNITNNDEGVIDGEFYKKLKNLKTSVRPFKNKALFNDYMIEANEERCSEINKNINDISSIFEQKPNALSVKNHNKGNRIKKELKRGFEGVDFKAISKVLRLVTNDLGYKVNQITKDELFEYLEQIEKYLKTGKRKHLEIDDDGYTLPMPHKTSWKSISPSISTLKKQFKACHYDLLAEFVDKSSFLMTQRFINNPKKAYAKKFQELCDFLINHGLSGSYDIPEKAKKIKQDIESKKYNKMKFK